MKITFRQIVGVIFFLNLALFFIFIFIHRFPASLMIIHALSLLVLCGLFFVKKETGKFINKRWKEIIAVCLLILISFAVRLYKIDVITPGMYGDEVTVARMSLDLLKNPDLPPFVTPYSHPTPLMYMTAFSVNHFGHTMAAIRLPSVIFGALSVGAFVILLRIFFPFNISVIGSSLMIFAYTQVVLSRLAYEPPASLFFQITAGIFLALFHRTKNQIYLIGIALSIGGGLYTYLNFRPFAIIVFLLTVFLIWRTSGKDFLKETSLFLAVLFISLSPLLSYLILDPHGFWLRTAEISIFGRGYPSVEFIKELGGNIYRTSAIPFIGDPNAGKNPAGTTLFDPLTMILAIFGLVILFIKKRWLFWGSLIFLLPPLISDIFSTEIIPEFHYYGLGHPNALRVSGFIVIILFLAAWAIQWIWNQWKEESYGKAMAIILVLIIGVWNYYLYFNQKNIHPTFYAYNYRVNYQDMMDAIKHINSNPNAQNISISKFLNGLEMTPFFINPSKKVSAFEPESREIIISTISSSDVTIIDVTDANSPILSSFTKEELDKMGYRAVAIQGSLAPPRIVLFEKISPL